MEKRKDCGRERTPATNLGLAIEYTFGYPSIAEGKSVEDEEDVP